MMSAVAENRLDLLDPAFTEQMYQCLNCRACEAVCPSGVQYGPLVEASRAQIEQHQKRPVQQRALRRVALGWLFGELQMKSRLAFLGLWLAGCFGLPFLPYGAGLFSSFVAVLDIALVFAVFKGDVRIN